jgi:hypothetical protein
MKVTCFQDDRKNILDFIRPEHWYSLQDLIAFDFSLMAARVSHNEENVSGQN